MIRTIIVLIALVITPLFTKANIKLTDNGDGITLQVEGGIIILKPLNDNSIRVKFQKSEEVFEIEELIYTEKLTSTDYLITEDVNSIILEIENIKAIYDKNKSTLSFTDRFGNIILEEKEDGRLLEADSIKDFNVFKAGQKFISPSDEYIYGTGQFQDGYLNIRGLSRRLTQVNSQISIPFILSSKGYGLLWNNYGLTEFNPSDNILSLNRVDKTTQTVTVDATGTSGNRSETRHMNQFSGTLDIPEDGKYSLLLDVGQTMARKHNLSINNNNIINVNNIWLPPTTSIIVELKRGKHDILVEGEQNDSPTLYWKKVNDETVFYSPVAQSVDYTVFAGNAEEVIASYRETTGPAPMMPLWALGYIHCRERYNTQDELLENARLFREKKIPLDMIVQDWQYWGKYGWNAMRFDEDRYPDPGQMVSELHEMNVKLMISVWSKIDKQSELGQEMNNKGYYIPETDWIDFFNPDASNFYWENFKEKLLPYKIDGWWLDATEPENDDLKNRLINNETLPGELLRNVYPLYVNRSVYNGLRKDDPLKRRAFILTRSGFSGIQRYGTATWSGDVGNDWESFRRQITGGLGQMSAGIPWWTYDAGGFFRPGDQYTNTDYHELFIRWFQTSTFFPLLRVHGYMSNTEPWRYGEEVENIVRKYLDIRYRMLPYIYSESSRVSFNGSTLMRPLIMDFADDKIALEQKHQFMFGPSLLIAPVTESKVNTWSVYLPENKNGWINFWNGKVYDGGKYIDEEIDIYKIPIFVKRGSIIPLGPTKDYSTENVDVPIEIRIYRGANASFTLYEDEGDNYNYEKGMFSTIDFKWDDITNTLTIEDRKGEFKGMKKNREFCIVLADQDSSSDDIITDKSKCTTYTGELVSVKF